MFEEKTLDEFNQLDDAAQLKYHADLTAHKKEEAEKMAKEIETLKAADGDNAEAIKELTEKVKALDVSKYEHLEQAMKDQGSILAKLIDGMGSITSSTVDQVSKFIEDNADKIKEMHAAGHGLIEFTTKAVGAITQGSATIVGTVPNEAGVQTAAPSNVNLRGVIVDELVTTFPTSQSAYAYTETTPKEGDYAFLAEAASKPQIDFKMETRYAEPVKVAAHEVLTTEAVQDIPNLQSIANDFLRRKHDLKRQNGLFFGDGTGANPKGATVYGRTFVAGDMASVFVAGSTNVIDVINACITDISVTHNYTDEESYIANVAMLNKVDFFIQLVAAKDADGHPLYPMASLFNRVVIGGVLIIPFEDIPAGKVFVADMSKYNVTRFKPYTVKIGWINDQLITNQFTMVGESRFHAFVKNLDEQAFIYDDIATIVAAIEV